MCRKKNFSTGNWRTLWKDFFPQPIHPHSTAPVDTGSACTQCARWLFANRYFPDPPGIVTAVEVGVSITSIKYQPESKPSVSRPLAPSVTCGDSSLPEGAMGCEPFHMGLCLWESADCESLSQKSKIFASSLWQGSLWLFPFTHPYHLVVEVQAVNLQLAGSSRRCTAAVDFVPGTTYKEALILAVMSRMLFCMVSLPPLRATSTLRMA